MRARRLLPILFAVGFLAGCLGEPTPATEPEGANDSIEEALPPGEDPGSPSDITVVANVEGNESPAPTLAPSPAPSPSSPPSPAPTPAPSPAPSPAAQPPPSPPPPPPAWPSEGSYVTVSGSAHDSAPNTYSNSSEWTATWTYRDGDWHGTCDGSWSHDWDESMEDSDRRDSTGTLSGTFDESDPPHWPLFNTKSPPAEGEEVQVWHMWDCRISSETMLYAGLETTSRWGATHTADDTQEAEENYSDYNANWDPETGLVLAWSWSRTRSGTHGEIVATDAPI